ncbi:hypothetical protein A3C96_02995 [Candidatus Uhrbacteria bacterium RIFCSPHIGHO2_02_FULL_60_10]|uniref:Uncharacterized protein n=1 Tax=Candidatus Uhrbacteria bacterium RIFCSPHIGHO2_02_FULL_60_10 TaxID=1802392 RepID=A0A1F7U728_9BACT|nr:MAG: hypothetical protein A3C96_02995 [Candidatus Uhrbacteria bacterium RIFCSPHIGHO2_02_FULL_60_10]
MAVIKPKLPGAQTIAPFMPFVVGVTAFGLLVAAWFLLFLPALPDLLAGGKFDIAAARARLDEADAYAARLDALKSAYEKINQDLNSRINKAMPAKPDVGALLVELNSIAEKNNYVMGNFSAVSEAGASSVEGRGIIRISMSLKGGDYQSFKRYLSTLETWDRLCDVQTISFGGKGGDYTVNLKVYYLAEATKAPAVTN